MADEHKRNHAEPAFCGPVIFCGDSNMLELAERARKRQTEVHEYCHSGCTSEDILRLASRSFSKNKDQLQTIPVVFWLGTNDWIHPTTPNQVALIRKANETFKPSRIVVIQPQNPGTKLIDILKGHENVIRDNLHLKVAGLDIVLQSVYRALASTGSDPVLKRI